MDNAFMCILPLAIVMLGCDSPQPSLHSLRVHPSASASTVASATPSLDSGPTEVPAPSSKPVDALTFAFARSTFAKLSKNPMALKPKQIDPPTSDEPWTSYEYDIPEIGNVVQTRWSPQRWSIMLTKQSSPEAFAPADALRPLDAAITYEYWLVTGGPFVGDFVFRSDGGIEVRTRSDVCGAETRKSGLHLVIDECNGVRRPPPPRTVDHLEGATFGGQDPTADPRASMCPHAAKRLLDKMYGCGLNTDGMNEAMLCGSMTYDKINFVDGLSCRELSSALH